jgi:hypothetical protein
MWKMNYRTLAILIAAILACQFTLSGRAAAAGVKSTALCMGNIQDTSGNVVANLNDPSLGYVSSYYNITPTDGTHQGQCVADVSDAATAWLKNTGQMCHAFFTAKSSDLIIHYKLGKLNKVGNLPYLDSGTATSASSYNYPFSCYGLSGYVFPSFYVSTLIYTPPGCTPSPTGYKCDSGSSVVYTSGSSAGSTTSIEKSIGTSEELTATLSTEVKPPDPPGGPSSTNSFGVSGGVSQTSTTGSSVTILHAISDQMTWPKSGPAGPDGINHDYDLFFILLNPAVAMTGWHDPINGQNHVQWSLGTKNSAPARIQHVQVSHLRCALAGIGPRPGATGNGGGNYDPTGSCSANPFLQMPGPEADASAPNGWLPGLTYDDYKQILAQDLFWNASPNHPVVIPTSRFVAQGQDYTYEQAIGPTGTSCVGDSHAIMISYSATDTSTTQTQYSASMTMSVGFPIGVAKLDLKSTTSFTWSNKTTNSLTNANNQSATGTVLCSSANWPGPNYITAYYDTVYGTILFALDDGSGEVDLLRGTITDVDGDRVPHEPLKLVVGNKTYQTFSRNNGSFLFHLPVGQASAGATTGTLFVGSTGAISKSVSVGASATATAAIPTPPPSLSVARGIAPGPPSPFPTGRMAAPVTPPPPPPAQVQAPIYIAVTNQSLFATAKNVKVTSVEATPKAGDPVVYSGTLPFAVPGGAALQAGSTVTFPLTFNPATEALSTLVVTVEADNLAPFSTVVIQPGGSPALQ